jgi:hypothetical protein
VTTKWRYSPKHVYGEIIKAHIYGKELGDVDVLQGLLDNVNNAIIAMKDARYTSMYMQTLR